MPLTPYGLREWLVMTIVAAAAAVGAALLGWWWAVILCVLIWLALVSFFRDPIRRVPTDLPAGTMLSPADGAISAIEQVADHPSTGGPAVIVRIFLSVLNVHVNRAPCACEVLSVVHTPGRYLDARSAESAKVNEANLLTLRRTDVADPDTIGVRQVSGAIARRIVCPVGPGDRLERGQKFGMIKFGSTTELILPRPDDVEILVEVGDRVRGGKTRLARLAASG
ncbi:MAG: phosphatidylserine decarboxylase family protein [Phycisphaerales bacterium]|nr:phosphatidylserine decarboxylase family protein [Phycisphaerales bacterium]